MLTAACKHRSGAVDPATCYITIVDGRVIMCCPECREVIRKEAALR